MSSGRTGTPSELGATGWRRWGTAENYPKATIALVVVILLIYLAAWARSGPLTGWGEVRASELCRWGALVNEQIAIQYGVSADPYRVFSALFVHGSAVHVLLNGAMLYTLGGDWERRFGASRLLCLFVWCGFWGFLASLFWSHSQSVGLFTVGASGAIFGLAGASLGVKIAASEGGIREYAVRWCVVGIVLSIGFPGINHAAHLGGFAAGLPGGWAVFRWLRLPRFRLIIRALAVLLVGLCVISTTWSVRGPLWKSVRISEVRGAGTAAAR
ncbi:MAG: rhomboid family intramembrane serine protease [Polyangiaceae bacterium]|nr:rhomboid family intramembrane serine protease [Polyangiaceae bacterium]